MNRLTRILHPEPDPIHDAPYWPRVLRAVVVSGVLFMAWWMLTHWGRA